MPALRSPLRPAIRSPLRSPFDPRGSGSGIAMPDFYVSNSGNDSNAGTLAAPFATLAKALSVWTTGKTIGLQYGSVWRESLDFANATNAGVVAYGTPGTLPIIDCSEPVTAGTWAVSVDPGAAGNVYEISRTALVNTGSQHQQVFQNTPGVYLIRTSSVANCQATPGSYYVTDTFSTGVSYKIYLHPVGSTSPIVNGISYSVAERLYGISHDGSGTLRLRNIKAIRALHHDGAIRQGGGTADIDGCYSNEGYIHNTVLENGTVSNCNFDDAAAGTNITFAANALGKVANILNCTVNNTRGIDAAGPAVFFHGNGFGMARNVQDLHSNGYSYGVTCADFDGTLIVGNMVFKSTTNQGCAVDLTDGYSSAGGDVWMIKPKTICKKLFQAAATGPATRVFIWEPQCVLTEDIVRMLNATEVHIIGAACVSSGLTGAPLTMQDPLGRSKITVKHCIIDMPGAGPRNFAYLDNGVSLDMDYNVYWMRGTVGAGDMRWNKGATTYYSFDNDFGVPLPFWQQTGQDAHSVIADPLWVNDPYAVTDEALLDFSVSGSSPAITVGAGPGRVPLDYVFPSWVPADVRALCGRA